MKALDLALAFCAGVAASALAQGCSSDGASASGDVADASVLDAASADVVAPAIDSSAASDSGVDAAPDGSSDAAVDATTPFTPKSVAGLALWLDPAAHVTETAGKVSAWGDSAASGITVAQPTAANQPTLGNTGGRPVIVGTPTTWLEASAAAVGTKLDFGDGDLLVECVMSVDLPSAALGGVLYKLVDGAPSPYDGLQVYGNITGDGKPGAGLDGDTLLVKAATGNTGDGKLHVVGFARFGNNLALRLDGAPVWTTPPSSGNKKVIDSASPLYVGGRPSGVHSIAHRLGDILVYKGFPTTVEVESIEGFLKTKYGL